MATVENQDGTLWRGPAQGYCHQLEAVNSFCWLTGANENPGRVMVKPCMPIDINQVKIAARSIDRLQPVDAFDHAIFAQEGAECRTDDRENIARRG